VLVDRYEPEDVFARVPRMAQRIDPVRLTAPIALNCFPMVIFLLPMRLSLLTGVLHGDALVKFLWFPYKSSLALDCTRSFDAL